METNSVSCKKKTSLRKNNPGGKNKTKPNKKQRKNKKKPKPRHGKIRKRSKPRNPNINKVHKHIPKKPPKTAKKKPNTYKKPQNNIKTTTLRSNPQNSPFQLPSLPAPKNPNTQPSNRQHNNPATPKKLLKNSRIIQRNLQKRFHKNLFQR